MISQLDQEPGTDHGADGVRENGVGRRLQQEDADGENWIPRGRIAGRHERIGRRVRQRLRQE